MTDNLPMMDYFNILPVEIISDILARLPAESILDCKSVSKTWGNLIQHPSFYKMHVNRLRHHVDSGKLGFLALGTDMTQLYYFEYMENHEKPIDRIRRISLKPPLKCDELVGSFNGLICLYGWPDRFCICNALTKEYVFLPELMQKPGQYYRWVGFGYLPSTNKYKVVVMHELEKERHFVEVMVYTLGSGNGWRNIGEFHLHFNISVSVPGIFVNGALHWKDCEQKMILVFDLADENFRKDLLQPPSPPPSSYNFIEVLSGSLYCASVYFVPDATSDLWLYKKKNDNNDGMKEQEEHPSMGWTKVFTAAYSKVFAITKSGNFLSHGTSHVDIYEPKGATSERLVDFKKQIRQIVSHKNTLVCLKELGEENTKIMEAVLN